MEQAINIEGTGLDLDNNLASLAPGDSPFRLNLRYGTSDRSDTGGGQTTLGSSLINLNYDGGFFIQPPGENEVIGSCKDPERDAIIYFVWNSNGLHQIRRYWTATRKIQLILESPVLNFQRSHKIVSANVVNNTLSWTDGWVDDINPFNYNGPRLIDIDKAYNHMLNNPWPLGYTTIDVQTISMIKYAPNLCPTFQYVNDLNFNDNRLYGHLFQFGYRYVYYDNSKSVISPLSKLTQPQGEDIEGNYDLTTENRLDITIETGHYTVVRIELVALEGTSYKVVDVIEKYDATGAVLIPSDSTHTIEFYNTKFIAEIPLEEALRPFDYVPQVAKTQEVVSSNQGARMLYGNFIEGYDNVPNFNLQADVKIEEIVPSSGLPGTTKFKSLTFKRKGTYQIGVVYADEAGRKSFVQTNDSLKLPIPWWNSTEIIGPNYDPTNEWILSSNQKPKIDWSLNSAPPSWAKSYQIVCSKNLTSNIFYQFYQFGAGIGDKDTGRYSIGKDTLYIPSQVGYSYTKGDRIRLVSKFGFFNDPTIANSSEGGPNAAGINAYNPMNNIGRGTRPESPYTFFPYRTQNVETYNSVSGEILDFEIESFDTSSQRIKFKGEFDLLVSVMYSFEIYNSVSVPEENQLFYEIGQSFPITNNQHTVTSGSIEGIDIFIVNKKYVFDKNPYRFPVSEALYPNAAKSNTVSFIIPGVDVAREVFFGVVGGVTTTGVSSDTFISGFCEFSFTPTVLVPPPSSPIVTISDAAKVNNNTPNVEDYNSSFSTLRTTRNLSDSFTTVILNAPDFTTWQDIVNNINGGDVSSVQLGSETTLTVISPNIEFNIIDVIAESRSYSEYYDSSNVFLASRPYIINKEAVRRQYVADIRNGGPVFDNTQINFFSRFVFDDLTKLNERYNEITRMQEVGFMLKVRQRNKSTSIYIGRTEITNADGSGNLASVNRILGTINPSDEIYGGTNGSSDTRAIRDTYFFDFINGAVIRDATNGLVAISGNKQSAADPYKMTSFFRDLGEFVRQNEEWVEVLGAWDENTTSYFLTIRDLRKRNERDPKLPDFVDKYKIKEAWNDGLTISFYETENRWQTFHSFIPEWYGSIGNSFVAFKDGEAWLHYSNSEYTSFFGSRYPIVSAQICNQFTNNIKVFDNIDVYSNYKWRAQGDIYGEDIYILPNAQFPTGMKSRLTSENFVGKEGKWHATFKADINSPGFSNELLALTNGRKLRGEAMKIILRNEDNAPVFIRQVIFHFTPSEISG